MANRNQRSVSDVIGLVAAICVVIGPILAWLRLLPALVGFYFFMLGGLVSLVVALIAIVGLVRGRGFGLGRTLALLAGAAFVFSALRAGDASRINDYTTNLDDPPAFGNAASLPENVGRDLSYPKEFAETQRSCCADLQPVHVAANPTETLRRAERVATQMPHWTVKNVDRENGIVEATSESVVFGFVDDVVIRVRPDGETTIVDVRSKSRQGKGDMGVNAARIRAYVAALKAAPTTAVN